MSDVLVAEGLSKFYGDATSLDDVSFSLGRAEVVGLLGVNGAGKSTLMNMLTGCLPPSAGRVSICGSPLDTAPREAKRHIGYLPEVPPLYMDMRVREQLGFVADLRCVAKAARSNEIDRVCALTDTLDVRARLIKQLSKGYRQRVGMAQALIGSPPLLILDEPTAGLDPKQITDFRALIAALRERHTILISSHILAEIASVCTRLLVLRKGRLVANDTPSQLGGAERAGERLALRARGDPERIRGILVDLPAIAVVELHAGVEPGCCDATLTIATKDGRDSNAGQDPRAAISMALAQASCPVVMMKPVGDTLEETFLRLAA